MARAIEFKPRRQTKDEGPSVSGDVRRNPPLRGAEESKNKLLVRLLSLSVAEEHQRWLPCLQQGVRELVEVVRCVGVVFVDQFYIDTLVEPWSGQVKECLV